MDKPVFLPAPEVLREIITQEVNCYPFVIIKIKRLKRCYKVTIDDGEDDETGKIKNIKEALKLCQRFHDWKLAGDTIN